MAALTADRVTRHKGPEVPRRATYLMAASTTIYKGALVCLNASGLAIPAADTAGITACVGVAAAGQVSLASGNFFVVCELGKFLLDVGAGITQADVGRNAVVADDQTVTDAAAGVNDIVVVTIVEYLDEAQDKAWVNIEGIAR